MADRSGEISALPQGMSAEREVGARTFSAVESNQIPAACSCVSEVPDVELDGFVRAIDRDMAEHPYRMRGFPLTLLERARAITADVLIDHDAAIDGAIPI
jgi:hypothetical protein